MTLQAIVVDIDDTLYLERDYVRSGFRAVADVLQRELSVCGFFEAAWREFEAGSRRDIFNRALASCGVRPDPDLIARLVAHYRVHRPRITIAEDARRFLREHSGLKTAALSDGPLQSQRNKAVALGLASWAHPIVLTDAHGAEFVKPSPRAFKFIQDQFDIAPDTCCYIADNPLKDFRGPKSLGWATVRVRRPGGLHRDVESLGDVDMEVESLDDLHLFRI